MTMLLEAENAELQRVNAQLQKELEEYRAERDEAVAQQTAAAEVLQVINSSHGDLAPVFGAILEKAHALCGATRGTLFLFDGETFRPAAAHGYPEVLERMRQGVRASQDPRLARLLAGERLIHVPDLMQVNDPIARAVAECGGVRTNLLLPLRKEGAVLGIISCNRQEVRPFTDKQIALLESFAAQAVIAIENARLITEQREALDQQTATAEVLRVISGSATDVQPVFEAITVRAAKLCEAEFSAVARFEDGLLRLVAVSNLLPDEARAFHSLFPRSPTRGFVMGRAFVEGRTVHVEDVLADPDYDPRTREVLQSLTGYRTFLGVPVLRDGKPIGVIGCARRAVRPFTAAQIELVSTFADQAVIAIENARLFHDLRDRTGDLEESLEYQTATSDVLKVISRSTFDLNPILEYVIETAIRLCRAHMGSIFRLEGGVYRWTVGYGLDPAYREIEERTPIAPGAGTLVGRVALERRAVQIADALSDSDYAAKDDAQLTRARTMLGVPLLREGAPVGVIAMARDRAEAFSDKEVALVTTFADQAVIAIENARLLGDLRQRTDDLQESLEYQTATSDVLKVISGSSFDIQPVFDTIIATAARLCSSDNAGITMREGEVYRFVSNYGFDDEHWAITRQRTFVPGHQSVAGRVALEGRVVHVADITAIPDYAWPEAVRAGLRTSLGVPLLREGAVVGTISLNRRRVEPFTERQIELVRTFADQAVIAIENARLLNEIRQRQAELRVTFDNMADGVVMFDEELRLAAWNRHFQGLLDVPDAFLVERPSYADYVRYLASRGEFGAVDVETELRRYEENVGRQWSAERTRPDGRVIEVRHNPVPSGGFVLIYADITERKRSEAEIRAARDAAEEASRTIAAAFQELKTAQARLIQAEKMASLGQLTAGIAHEIKNPLNFVNNFAGLSVELLDELKETAAPAIAGLAEEQRADVDELVVMLTGNLQKIAKHGRRADGIVTSMLEHSRGESGERRAVDLNALVEEALNLAYHGARAQDQKFNITLEREYAPAIAPIELVPQDITRVCLNLFGNGFYAAAKRQREGGDPKFKPTLKVTTYDLGGAVEIRVRDNGAGIPPEIRDKLFQPFFTTKPTGEGTGLGLSISWDIVTQQHGGTITVDSRVGEFTEFTIRLPRAHGATTPQAMTEATA